MDEECVNVCECVGWGVHCKCFLAYPVWLFLCLNQSCRWSDLSLARLWCETISPGPWGPPTVKPTAFPDAVDAARIHVHPTDHFHVVMGRLKFFFSEYLAVSWMLNYFKSPLVRTEIAAAAVYWQRDYTVSLMWLSLSHCIDCSCVRWVEQLIVLWLKDIKIGLHIL